MMRRGYVEIGRHTDSMLYIPGEMTGILSDVGRSIGDPTLTQNVYFSPTALTHIRRMMQGSGSIITDTQLTASGIDRAALAGKDVEVKCFIDSPKVTELARARGITRAEIAADYALAEPGPKLLVYGSAPAGIQHIMHLRQLKPFNDVCLLAGPTGFAGSIQLKERLTESDLTCIVIRGRKGGIPTTVAVLNAILNHIANTL